MVIVVKMGIDKNVNEAKNKKSKLNANANRG